MAPGDYGNKTVPTYIAAEAETTPLPKITVPEAPPPTSSGRGLGDLPMRVVYRVIAGAAVVVVVLGAVATVVVINKDDPAAGAQAAGIPTAEDTLPTTMSSTEPTDGATSGAVAAAAGQDDAVASPLASHMSSDSEPSDSEPSDSGSSGSSSGKRSAMDAALSDPRVPTLPASNQKLRALPGRTAASRGLIKDRRSGVAFPRFAKEWTAARGNPFASRQMLPKVKGSELRGMLVSCPVPIPVQDSLRDTAFLAARWTLNHHPAGATITWAASQPIEASERDGWLLGYRVNYTIKDKERTSMAAVALVDVPDEKPALVFITIPDTQKKHWKDINKVMSSLKALPTVEDEEPASRP